MSWIARNAIAVNLQMVSPKTKPCMYWGAHPAQQRWQGCQSVFSCVGLDSGDSVAEGKSQTKMMRNILHCLEHEVQMGWLINPDEELIFVYRDD